MQGAHRHNASLAQLVEQLTLNQFVRGSSPRGGTEKAAFRLPFLFVGPTRYAHCGESRVKPKLCGI